MKTNLFAMMMAMGFLAMACNMTPLKEEGKQSFALKAVSDGNDKNCNDNNVCTADGVNKDTKFCEFTPIVGCCKADVDCDDKSACTDDACTNNKCVNTPIVCDDKNVCTDDSCDPVKGCVFTNNIVACDDADACTTADTCKDGKCSGGPALVCDDKNVCTNDACDKAKGCTFTPNTAACDDTSACTDKDVCANGKCAGIALVCDDKNVCTNDSCDPAKGCVYTNNILACDDGSKCTDKDVCGAGKCAGVAIVCDDKNPCTTDSCDPAKGCVQTPIDGCCTTDDQCFALGETSWGFSKLCDKDVDCDVGELCIGKSMCLPAAYDFGCSTFDDILGNPEMVPGTCEVCADTNNNGTCSTTETFCEGGLDEDADSLVDCEDSECSGKSCGVAKKCAGGLCVDDTCVPVCTGKECGPDGCGKSCGDCVGPAVCSIAGKCEVPVPPAPEGTQDCSDGKDNDNDGLVDCLDPGCANAENCKPLPPVQCTKDADCAVGEFCGGNFCYAAVDVHGMTGIKQSGANGGPFPDGTPDSWDNDGDCYCESLPCLGSVAGAACEKLFGGDCDDTPTGWANHPGATEWLDGFDNDCNGEWK